MGHNRILFTYQGPCGPRKCSFRDILDAIFYLEKTACQRRMLSNHFLPWKSVYELYYRWRIEEKWDQIHNKLHSQLRQREGKKATPSVAIIDSPSVKTAQKGEL